MVHLTLFMCAFCHMCVENLLKGPANSGCQIFFFIRLIGIVPSYHPTHFKGKLMNQTGENGEKTNFGLHFGLFDPNLGLEILEHIRKGNIF